MKWPSHDCVRFEHVAAAMHRIRGGIVRTSCQRSHWLSEITGSHVHFKLEQQQFTGSFKERGARNALLSLDGEARRRGVVAAWRPFARCRRLLMYVVFEPCWCAPLVLRL